MSHSRRRLAGLTGVAAALLVGGIQALPGWADEANGHRRWRSADELLQSGVVAEPIAILEAALRYDADASPALQVKHVAVKRGYAPQYEPLDAGYVLSLHAENGDTLSSLTFAIPNVVYNPPPLSGEDPGHGPSVLRAMDFSLTVPMVDGAVELRLTDPQGVVMAQESLRRVPVQHNAPQFRSLPPGQGDGARIAPQWIRWRTMVAALADRLCWMETAEAAGDAAALDVTFVGDNYTTADLTMFHQDVDRAIAHMLTYEPYASRESQILFHAVDNTDTDLGCVHDAATTRLITCNNATVTSVVNTAGAPYDKIIVLVNDPAYGGSGGGSAAVSYNGSSAPQVVTHEFGHTLGALADEYNLYTTNGTLSGSTYANCYAGVPPASAWDGVVSLTDYAIGCKYPNWYRSSPCSIMLSLSCQYFNAVSRNLLDAKLDLYAGTPTPGVTLSATPVFVGVNGTSTLTWTGSNVTSCTASGGWSGAKPTSGSETVSPAATATYTLACSGSSSVTQSVTVTVDDSAPAASLTNPVDGATVSGTVTVSASASDNQQVDRVDFFKDSALLGSDNSSPYGMNWNAGGDTPGAHSLMVKAYDRAGNLGVSSPVSVTVQQSAQDIQAPVVTITNPSNGSQLTANNTKISAAATDNVSVTRMELRIDGSLKTTSTGGTLGTGWRTRSLAASAHTLETKAFDAVGNIGTVTITVFK